MTITPGKNFEGQQGFPTPSDIPSDTACRSFVLPDNDEWLGLLMGAVELLLNPHNYFNYGALSIDDTVDHWQLIVQDAYDRSLTSQCGADVDAPYWDTAADVPAQAPSTSQPWYGILDSGLTWREHMEDFVLAGFVAYAAGLGAAVTFLTLATRFRLAWKAHNLGSIVQVFIDGAEYGTIDTYDSSGKVVYMDVFAEQASPGPGPWQLTVEQASSSQMQLIRKQLDPGEVYPTNQRYDSGTDTTQTDFGSGFVDTPLIDPRHSAVYLYPPVGGADPKCLAAGNMVDYFANLITQIENALSLGANATGLWAVIMPLLIELGPFAILIELVAALATVAFTAGETALAASFTTATYDTLLCIFYCSIDSAGQVDSAALTRIEGDILTDFGSGVVNDVMSAALFLMGEVGLSNVGTLGSSTRDCSGCDCTFCYHFDFHTASYSTWFSPDSGYGTYVSGQGWWGGVSGGLILQLDMPAGAQEVVTVDATGTSFGGIGPYGRAVFWRLSGSNLYTDNQTGISSPWTVTSSQDLTVDQFWFNPYNGGSDVYITEIFIHTRTAVSAWSAYAC